MPTKIFKSNEEICKGIDSKYKGKAVALIWDGEGEKRDVNVGVYSESEISIFNGENCLKITLNGIPSDRDYLMLTYKFKNDGFYKTKLAHFTHDFNIETDGNADVTILSDSEKVRKILKKIYKDKKGCEIESGCEDCNEKPFDEIADIIKEYNEKKKR